MACICSHALQEHYLLCEGAEKGCAALALQRRRAPATYDDATIADDGLQDEDSAPSLFPQGAKAMAYKGRVCHNDANQLPTRCLAACFLNKDLPQRLRIPDLADDKMLRGQ